MTDTGLPAERRNDTTIKTTDGHAIPVITWSPQDKPAAILQIFHGLSEHAERYARFANAATAAGYMVVAHDHRGHGKASPESGLGHFSDADGWNLVLQDAKSVQENAGGRYPGLPVILLGHSMGSYIAQDFVMRHPHSVSALVLSGSTMPSRLKVRVGRWVARWEALRRGRRHRSQRLNAMGFGAFNRRFEPARTPFDWLSRDPAEVDLYISDPLCGSVSSATLWQDLLGGLLAISSVKALQRIPSGLPVLITGGENDPVGGRHGMTRLAAAYERTGHTAVTLRIYSGGRHEMLNETNRDEVTADILDWLERTPL
ncbi:MAG: alpha/beta hydrolase [Woeseia sp.]